MVSNYKDLNESFDTFTYLSELNKRKEIKDEDIVFDSNVIYDLEGGFKGNLLAFTLSTNLYVVSKYLISNHERFGIMLDNIACDKDNNLYSANDIYNNYKENFNDIDALESLINDKDNTSFADKKKELELVLNIEACNEIKYILRKRDKIRTK